DQHAIAYMLFNADRWIIDGVTTNRTQSGGDITMHTAEARRVVALCASDATVKVYSGANGNFDAIKGTIGGATYDGKEAVDFIISRARMRTPQDKLLLIPTGKLTNVALALMKDPTIAANMRVVWLGSNWPTNTTEYNEVNDLSSVNYLMDSTVEF